jgi:hypothetical protein
MRLRLDFSALVEMTKSGGELFRSSLHLQERDSSLHSRMTSFYGLTLPLLLLAWSDYVSAPSHYERSFGYAQDDTARGAACLAAIG